MRAFKCSKPVINNDSVDAKAARRCRGGVAVNALAWRPEGPRFGFALGEKTSAWGFSMKTKPARTGANIPYLKRCSGPEM